MAELNHAGGVENFAASDEQAHGPRTVLSNPDS